MSGLISHRRLIGLASVVLLGSCVAGARWQASHTQAGAMPAPPAPAAEPGVVCFGYADVEGGTASLHPLASGRVTAVAAREGQAVAQGAELLRLDDALARLRVREAEADLAAAKEQLTQARRLPQQHEAKLAQQRAAAEVAEQRGKAARHLLARKRDLLKAQAVNAREVDVAEAAVAELEAVERGERAKLAELELNDPQAGVARAEAEVRAREARLEEARHGVEECVLRAPTAGTVLRVLVNVGDVLGTPARQAAVLFCPAGRRIIRAEVEQEFAGRVRVGLKAAVQDDAAAGPTWRGEVLQMAGWYSQRRAVTHDPMQFNDVRTLECLIALEPGQPELRIGQRVRVSIGSVGP